MTVILWLPSAACSCGKPKRLGTTNGGDLLDSSAAKLWTLLTNSDPPSPDARVVSLRQRVIAAIGVGVAAGLFCYLCNLRAGATPDFAYPLRAARYFFGGGDPYTALGVGLGADKDALLIFPFTTVLAATPFVWFSVPVGAACFFGVSTALLAFFITRDGLWRLHVFASGPFVVSAVLAQFAPLLMVMAFVPAAGFLAVLKPNLGLAMLVRRPSVRAILGCVVALAISLLVFPRWPWEWLAALRVNNAERAAHLMPIRVAGGFVLALAIVGWRRPAGRLLLAMSVIPQVMLFYDALPLWLVPRTRQQSIFLTACSQLAVIAWYFLARPGSVLLLSAAPFVVWLVYVPALVIVLNEALGVRRNTYW